MYKRDIRNQVSIDQLIDQKGNGDRGEIIIRIVIKEILLLFFLFLLRRHVTFSIRSFTPKNKSMHCIKLMIEKEILFLSKKLVIIAINGGCQSLNV